MPSKMIRSVSMLINSVVTSFSIASTNSYSCPFIFSSSLEMKEYSVDDKSGEYERWSMHTIYHFFQKFLHIDLLVRRLIVVQQPPISTAQQLGTHTPHSFQKPIQNVFVEFTKTLWNLTKEFRNNDATIVEKKCPLFLKFKVNIFLNINRII